MADFLKLDREGGVARITLNRPDAGNTLNIPLSRELMEAALDVDADTSVRCVVLTGAGRMFCAGGDVTGFSAAGDKLPQFLKETTAYVDMAVARLARMPKPLVTVINGPAAGAGIGLALLGDIVIAARSAKFNLGAYAGVGLSPDGGTSWLLPRVVGLRRAQELLLTGGVLTADQAASEGLATRAVDDDQLGGEVEKLVSKLVASPTRALGRARNLLLSTFQTSLEEQMELESRAIAQGGMDPESAEGVGAFLGKRKPDFTKL